MAVYQWEIQEYGSCCSPRCWLSRLVISICSNPKEVGSNAREGMDLLARIEQAGKEQKLPSSMSLYRRPAEGMAWIISPIQKIQIKIASSHFKWFNYEKNLSHLYLASWVLVNSRWSQVNNQEYPLYHPLLRISSRAGIWNLHSLCLNVTHLSSWADAETFCLLEWVAIQFSHFNFS